MPFRQEPKKAQKQKVSLSPKLLKTLKQLEESNLETQDRFDLDFITDIVIEEVPSEVSDDVSVPDVDEDGRVNEDIDWDRYLPKDDTNRIERQIREKAIPPYERASSELTHDLSTHLMFQLLLSNMNLVQKEIGAYLIGNLNENGYLDTSIEELWHGKQKYQLDTWYETVKLLQKFDPEGIAARDLQECLLIQAKSEEQKNTLVEKIIKNQWDNLLNRKCDIIAKNLSVPLYDVHAAISVISGFDPRPGQRFNNKVYFKGHFLPYNDSAFHIQPDFYIYKNGNNYRIDPIGSYIDARAYDYFYDKIESGNPLTVKDIEKFVKIRDGRRKFSIPVHNRHKNIVNFIKSILRFQKEFFNTGSMICLRPLIARSIANEINLDESTVRRIWKNKYVDTPHGIFELSFFFDKEGYDTHDGVKMASKVVKELIKNIVKSENKEKPVRDKKIADILNDNYNVKIEPRTVAKYREAMGILSARLRKWPC